MQFKDKLDYMMILTKTSNSHLAKIATLDNSFVCRLRNGSRMLSKNESYTPKFAAYFAKQIRTEHLRNMLSHAISIDYSELPRTDEEVAQLIQAWLTDDKKDTKQAVNAFIRELKSEKKISVSPAGDITLRAGYKHDIESYIGQAGLCDALINFLQIVKSSNITGKLYIFEDSNALLNDKLRFQSKYFALLMQLIEQGFEIYVVFNVNKAADITLPIITSWLPLLLTGSVHAYYFPRYRDQLFHHHFMVIPDRMALVQNRFHSNIDSSITNIYTNKIISSCFTAEFASFLSQCRLLSSVVKSTGHQDYLEPLLWFDTQMEDAVIKTPCMTSITMPLPLVKEIFKDIKHKDKNAYLSFHEQRSIVFEEYLQQKHYVEIISLPSIETVLAGQARISYPDTFSLQERYYSLPEYCRHLQNIIYLLKKHPNFEILLAPSNKNDDISIEVRENTGVVFAKSSKTTVYFLITEPTTTNILGDYLQDIIHYLPAKNKNRQYVINNLQTMLKQLKSSC